MYDKKLSRTRDEAEAEIMEKLCWIGEMSLTDSPNIGWLQTISLVSQGH